MSSAAFMRAWARPAARARSDAVPRVAAAAALPRATPGGATPAGAARPVTHYYGGLERFAKGAAGAAPKSIDIPYVDQLRAEHLLGLRMHLGHHKRRLDKGVSGLVYGFRHNIAIYDITKTWSSLRTLFYGFAEMAQVRSTFFLLAPNPQLKLRPLIEQMRREYPFRYNKFSSLSMVGYADTKWVDGTFSNWKETVSFYQRAQKALREKTKVSHYRKVARYLRGIEGLDYMTRIVPDFILAFATDYGAVHEARNLDIPLVGMVDTNTNPAPFLYPVFGNDDSVATLQFMIELLKRATEEGRKREHEAFATLLVRKIKDRLDPVNARSGMGAGSDADSDFDDGAFTDEETGAKVGGKATPGAGGKGRSATPAERARVLGDVDFLRKSLLASRQPTNKLPRVE